MNVIEAITAICNRLALQAPNTAVGSEDTQIIQLLSLFTEAGQEMRRRYRWSQTVQLFTFSTTAVYDQGALSTIFPASFNLDYILDQTIWNSSIRLPIFGPNSPQKLVARIALPLTGPYTEYYIQSDPSDNQPHLYFNPYPAAAGQTLLCEAVSKNWLMDENPSNGGYSVPTDDTNNIVLDETCIILSTIWRWKAAKGLDYGEDFNKYEMAYMDAAARDGTKPVLSLDAGELNNTVQPVVIIPSGGWNLI